MIYKNYLNKGLYEDFFLLKQKKQKYFCTGCPKSALRRNKTKFLDFFLHINNKKFGKVNNFQVWELINLELTKPRGSVNWTYPG